MSAASTRTSAPVIDQNDKWMSIREVAEYYSIHRASVYKLMDNGQLPYIKVGQRRRIKQSDVRALELAGS